MFLISNRMSTTFFFIFFMFSRGLCLVEITQHPETSLVTRNEPVTLHCEAKGDPIPEIVWWKNGERVITADMDHKSHRVLLPAGSLFFLKAVQTRKESDAGVYKCQAKNSMGEEAFSQPANLTIAVLKDKFRLEPDDIGIQRGQSARFVCSPPRGTPEPTVFWTRDGKIIDLDIETRYSIDPEDATSLVISNVTDQDEAKYQCVAKNQVGIRKSQIALLSIQIKPYVIKHPENVSAVTGQDITMACVVGGKPKPEIRWSRRNGRLPSASRAYTSHNSAALNIQNVRGDDEDEYICLAENPAGSVKSSGLLKVQSPPIFLITPEDATATAKKSAQLDCVAAGNPTPTLFWMKEGGSGILLTGTSQDRFRVTREGTLVIENVDETDEGWYACAAVSESGSVMSTAKLQLGQKSSIEHRSSAPPPVIQLGPVNQTLPLGSDAALPCESLGQTATIWLKDGVPVSTIFDPRITVQDHTLHIKDLRYSDSGLYSCQARSSSGQAVLSASVSVLDKRTNPNAVFSPMPSLADFPGSPSTPSLVNATSHSIKIEWEKPMRIGGSSLQGYQLEYYVKRPPFHWITIPDVQEETFTVDGLPPSASVIVLVRAQNRHGLSPPSPKSKVMMTLPKPGDANDPRWIRMELSGKKINLVETLAIGARKIKISWKVSKNHNNIEGYHIQVKDHSAALFSTSNAKNRKISRFDVVTIAGGATRSHTLSDLRPDTSYSIFVIPYNARIKGMPSNMKTARTKEDVPAAPPRNVRVHLINSTSAEVQWQTPDRKDLNGDLKGFKVLTDINGTEFSNFTLEPEISSWVVGNLNFSSVANEEDSSEGRRILTILVAAYNRQGIGPFSEPAELVLDPDFIHTTGHHANLASNQIVPFNVDETSLSSSNSPSEVLVVQEVWFVGMISLVTVLVLVGCLGLVVAKRFLLRKRDSNLKEHQYGHYNVPLHKVEDIAQLSFTDRDHLWFNPMSTPIKRQNNNNNNSSQSSTSLKPNSTSSEILGANQNRNSDPMADMLDSALAKNKSTPVLLNTYGDYAEVTQTGGMNNFTLNGDNGPYATTNLVDGHFIRGDKKSGSLSSGSRPSNPLMLTSTSLGIGNKKDSSSSTSLAGKLANSSRDNQNPDLHYPEGSSNKGSLSSSHSGGKGSNVSRRSGSGSGRRGSDTLPPPPPPPSNNSTGSGSGSTSANIINSTSNNNPPNIISNPMTSHYLPSPLPTRLLQQQQHHHQSGYNMHKDYGRLQQQQQQPGRAGSFSSFGHYAAPGHFMTPQGVNIMNQSQYSMPGFIFHPGFHGGNPTPNIAPGSCCASPIPHHGFFHFAPQLQQQNMSSNSGPNSPAKAAAAGTNKPKEQHYESASLCYGPVGRIVRAAGLPDENLSVYTSLNGDGKRAGSSLASGQNNKEHEETGEAQSTGQAFLPDEYSAGGAEENGKNFPNDWQGYYFMPNPMENSTEMNAHMMANPNQGQLYFGRQIDSRMSSNVDRQYDDFNESASMYNESIYANGSTTSEIYNNCNSSPASKYGTPNLHRRPIVMYNSSNNSSIYGSFRNPPIYGTTNNASSHGVCSASSSLVGRGKAVQPPKSPLISDPKKRASGNEDEQSGNNDVSGKMNYTQSKFNSKETEQNPNNFKLEFSKVSENMNELVEHLNTIQNDLANQLKNQENTNS